MKVNNLYEYDRFLRWKMKFIDDRIIPKTLYECDRLECCICMYGITRSNIGCKYRDKLSEKEIVGYKIPGD